MVDVTDPGPFGSRGRKIVPRTTSGKRPSTFVCRNVGPGQLLLHLTLAQIYEATWILEEESDRGVKAVLD